MVASEVCWICAQRKSVLVLPTTGDGLEALVPGACALDKGKTLNGLETSRVVNSLWPTEHAH